MKKQVKKLRLSRETIRTLEERRLEEAAGAGSGFATVCNCSVCTGCEPGCISGGCC